MNPKDYVRAIKQKRKGIPAVHSVLLHRDGSGGGVIDDVPNEKWLSSMSYLKRDGYMAYTRIIIAPTSDIRYGGYHGCRLIFLPGNNAGSHQDTKSMKESVVWDNQNLDSPCPYFLCGAFAIATSLADLEAFHKALGDTIKDIKRRKKKEK